MDRNIPLTKAESNWFGGKPPSEAPQVPKSFQGYGVCHGIIVTGKIRNSSFLQKLTNLTFLFVSEFSNYGIQITQPDNPGIFQHVSMFLSYQQPGYSAIHIDAPSATKLSFSSLNPNAKVFTPLNPNAKEFTPSKSKLSMEKESNLCNGSTKCQSGALTKNPVAGSLEVSECPNPTEVGKEVSTLQSSPRDLQPDLQSLCALHTSSPQSESNCSTATLATEPPLRATTDHLRTPHVKSLSCEDTHRDKDNVETDDDSDDDLFGNGVYDDSDEDDLERDEIRRFSESSGDDK